MPARDESRPREWLTSNFCWLISSNESWNLAEFWRMSSTFPARLLERLRHSCFLAKCCHCLLKVVPHLLRPQCLTEKTIPQFKMQFCIWPLFSICVRDSSFFFFKGRLLFYIFCGGLWFAVDICSFLSAGLTAPPQCNVTHCEPVASLRAAAVERLKTCNTWQVRRRILS